MRHWIPNFFWCICVCVCVCVENLAFGWIHLPTKWKVVPLGISPLIEHTWPCLLIWSFRCFYIKYFQSQNKPMYYQDKELTLKTDRLLNSCQTAIIDSDRFIVQFWVTLHFSSLCCFISAEPLPGPPYCCCCLPVLQWYHWPWLCHYGDI